MSKKRKTVFITGASSGIGMEFARVFASMGYRLILTARREERLNQMIEEVDVPCEKILADLSKEEECHKLLEQLRDETIDVFINNAGFGICGTFAETELEKEIDMIHVNVVAMHILFKGILQKMKQAGKGNILNVASSAGLLPAGPFMATYYATKSYVASLTKAVAEELKEEGSPVYVGALCPGPVDTEFNEHADVEFALKGISAKECVREAMWGIKKRKVIIVPSAIMKLARIGQNFLPEPVLLKVVAHQQKKKSGKESV